MRLTKEEFKSIREALDLTVEQLATKLEVSKRTITNMQNGAARIDLAVSDFMRNLLKEKAETIFIDVSSKDKVSLTELIEFCFSKKNRKAFLNSEEMKQLIENIKLEERNNIYEKHIILKNRTEPEV